MVTESDISAVFRPSIRSPEPRHHLPDDVKEGLWRDGLLGLPLAQRQQHLPQLLRHDGAVAEGRRMRGRRRRRPTPAAAGVAAQHDAVLVPRLALHVVARRQRRQLVQDAAELLNVAENIYWNIQ